MFADLSMLTGPETVVFLVSFLLIGFLIGWLR